MKLSEFHKLCGRVATVHILKVQSFDAASGQGNRAARRAGDPPDFRNIDRWRLPDSYFGAKWSEYYVFLGRSRDSDCLEESNFVQGLSAIGGERTAEDESETPLVLIVRESHWACGWVEWIAIHESQRKTLAQADHIKSKLADYPVLDESDFSEREDSAAQEVWADCFDDKERLQYVREHRSQFECDSMADLFALVRGRFFNGYASELIA